jgi:uncharacterized protein YqhQ
VEGEEKLRLGGMALANGVLVHGPNAWACAIRGDDGELKVVAEPKRFRANRLEQPLLRGPARLLEAFAVLPSLKRRLPEARFPFERPAVVASVVVAMGASRAVRLSRLGPLAKELVAGALSLLPASVALRGSSLAAYHGAEHISIGTYEHGEARPKEHERCGSHLVGPLIITSAAGGALAAQAPEHLRGAARAGASLGAIALATEIFGWMVRHPDHPLAEALARPGHELQHRLATAEPDASQIEVADAALAACLELEERERAAEERRQA